MIQLQVSRVALPYNSAGDTPFLLLPIIYDIDHNTTGMANKNETPPSSNSLAAAIQHIKNFQSRFNDYNTSQQLNECSIFPTIRDFLTNFPSEQQPQVNIP